MKKLSLSICLAFAFFVASAVAQVAPGGSQGTQNSSPGVQQPGENPNQQPGIGRSDNSVPTSQTDQGATNQNHNNGGERKIKGCVQSQGGQYMLETKKGKAVALSGQDVSAHVGHEVAVKGTWESGGSSSTSSSGNASSSGKTFNVTGVDMISETCGGKSKSSSGSMGNTSSSPSGTTGSSPSGNSSQPPQ